MADTKISALTAIDAVAAADLLAIVDDPAGTPTSKKVTAEQLATYVESALGLGTMAAETAADYTPTSGLGTAAFDDATDFAVTARGLPAGGTDGQVLTKTSGTDYAVAWEDAAGGGSSDPLDLSDNTPGTPAAGTVRVGRLTIGPWEMAQVIGPSGIAVPIGMGPFFGSYVCVVPNGGFTAPTAIGCTYNSNPGTGTVRVPASTNFITSISRNGVVSSASAGNSAQGRVSSNQYQFWRGNAANLGGFRAFWRFCNSDASYVSGSRLFVGLNTVNGSMSNADPSALVNCIGLGADSGDSNLQIMHNDGSGTATKVSLGANFPHDTTNADLYDLILLALPNASEVEYFVGRRNAAGAYSHTASGTITTDLPASTVFMTPQFWRNNGATAAAVGIDIAGFYGEAELKVLS